MEQASIQTYDSAIGDVAVNINDPADRIYALFRNFTNEQFLFIGQEDYLDYVPIQTVSHPIIRYINQLFLLIKQTFYAPTYGPKTQWNVREPTPNATSGEKDDFFCSERAKAQVLWEGKTVQILYPDNPTVHKHFLVATKEHRASFSEMTQEEFVEVMGVAKRIKGLFDGKAVYLCKTGIDAGQTVPHFHFHIMIMDGTFEGIWGRLKVARNILSGLLPFLSKRLEGEALTNRVNEFMEPLKCLSS